MWVLCLSRTHIYTHPPIHTHSDEQPFPHVYRWNTVVHYPTLAKKLEFDIKRFAVKFRIDSCIPFADAMMGHFMVLYAPVLSISCRNFINIFKVETKKFSSLYAPRIVCIISITSVYVLIRKYKDKWRMHFNKRIFW